MKYFGKRFARNPQHVRHIVVTGGDDDLSREVVVPCPGAELRGRVSGFRWRKPYPWDRRPRSARPSRHLGGNVPGSGGEWRESVQLRTWSCRYQLTLLE